MKQFTKFGAAVAMAVAAMTAQAELVIDNFSSGSYVSSVIANAATPTPPVVFQSGLSGVIGGVREAAVQYVSGPGNVAINISSNNPAGVGTFTFSQDQDTAGRAQLWWDGIANGVNDGLGGALNANLTLFGNAFDFTASTEINATPGAYRVQILAYSDSGVSAVEFSATDTGGLYVPVSIPFGDFVTVAGGGADFTDIDALYVGFNTNTTARITVDVGVRAIKVPEPGALALASIALLGVWAARRRRVG